MNKIKDIVEKNNSKSGRIFDLCSQFLIFISLISFSIETLPNNSSMVVYILDKIELFTILVFTIEYVLRVLVSDRKFKFIFSFYGIVDLLAIVPFYISFGVDLRSIRVVRFFRLIRLFKLFRYNSAIFRLISALKNSKEELIIFTFVTTMLLFVSSIGIYYFERDAQPELYSSVFHSLWWSVITLTTVGYGDMYPITVGGKLFTAFISFLCLGVVAVPTSIISSSLVQITKNKESKNISIG